MQFGKAGALHAEAASFELDLLPEPRTIRSEYRSFPMPNSARSILIAGILVFSPWVLAQGDLGSISGMVSDSDHATSKMANGSKVTLADGRQVFSGSTAEGSPTQ